MKRYNINSLKERYNIETKGKNGWVYIFTFVIIASLIALILGISFLITSFVYWLFTLVMANFFSIIIPFAWHYALGVWLIVILIRFIFGGIQYTTSTKN